MQLLPALESGGVERSTIEIAQALVQAGHRAVVVSRGGRLVPDLEATGAIHLELDIGRKSLFTLRHIFGLRQLIQEHQPDIVHARSRLPAWIACIMTRGERVICVSDSVRAYVTKYYRSLDPSRLRVIERGIDAAAFPRGYRADAAWREQFYRQWPALVGRPWFVLPGRGTRLKGHLDAIDLIARMRAAGLNVGLLLQGVVEAGRERYLDELRRSAAERGVADAVVLAPPRRDIREVMAESFAVLQLSTKPEAFGRTVAEALSLGTPVLGWDRGGVGELLARGFPAGAIAVDDRDALLARAKQWVLARPEVAPFKPYTLAQMQEASLAVYDELAHAR